MVEFSVFNELSLPLDNKSSFSIFFKVLKKLNDKGFKTIRMDREFKEYPEILPNISLQEFFGTLDKDEKNKLRTFINNGITIIESPLIKDEEIEDNEEAIENEYLYNGKANFGGLACADIWNTVAISFSSNNRWDSNNIILERNGLDINIRHISTITYLDSHREFFKELEKENRLNITQECLWDRQKEFFPNKILFCKEIKNQIKELDKIIFQQAISILRDIENSNKKITDYNYSGESKSVQDDEELKKQRYFTINEKKVYFDNHIKYSSHRLYFLEQENKIYIGYIGKHLPTKKYK